MPRLANLVHSERSAQTLSVLSATVLFAVMLSACGTSSTPAPASVAPSVVAASESPATASSTPIASATPSTPSSTPVQSSASGSFDACALLTDAEIGELLGTDAVQARPMPAGGWIAGQCAWNGPTAGLFLGVGTAASIAAFGDPLAPDAKAKFELFKSGPGTPKDVAGIGDGAVVSSNGIAAYQGDTYLEITNLGLTEEQLVDIMKLAIANL